MSDQTIKPSGPLWAWADSSGAIQVGSISPVEGSRTRFPVRAIPGHGKVVPVELVEAIKAAHYNLLYDDDDDCGLDALNKLREAIDAAIGGAM